MTLVNQEFAVWIKTTCGFFNLQVEKATIKKRQQIHLTCGLCLSLHTILILVCEAEKRDKESQFKTR